MSLSALLFEVLYLSFKKENLKGVASALIVLTAIAAVITAITGLIAASTVPHPDEAHPLMDIHKEIELIGGTLSILAALSMIFTKNRLKWVRSLLVLVTAATISYGAWYGGRLVYTYGIGTALVKEGMVDSTGPGDMGNMKMDSSNHGEGKTIQRSDSGLKH